MHSGELCGRHYSTGRPVSVGWRDGRITEVEPAPGTCPDDVWLAPCLVDLQVNGYRGVDFQRDDLLESDLTRAAE